MDQARLTYLFNSYYHKTASQQEREEFLDLVAESENDEALKSLLTEKWLARNNDEEVLDDTQADEMLLSILHPPVNGPVPLNKKTNSIHQLIRISAAASILLVIGTGLYFLLKPQPLTSKRTQQVQEKPKNSIEKGGKKAVLTLGDGSEITLDTTQQGMLTRQGNAKVSRQNLATVAYHTENGKEQAVVYNTLSTPKGGQYQLILPDQTRVWLNSSSSIRFPTQFSGKERNVSLTGEAYFEVSKNAKMPFKISVNQMQVQVLGTHFNIMAYADESSVNTALLEGSVKVTNGNDAHVLVPGQESRVSKNGSMTVVAADVDGAVAWKNGWFNFNQCDLQKVMRQISRWYDVEVVYQGKIPTGHFSGIISQANDISKVLDLISAGGVNFKIEGRKIIVLP